MLFCQALAVGDMYVCVCVCGVGRWMQRLQDGRGMLGTAADAASVTSDVTLAT